jgi:hypothetical protein
MLVDVTGIAGKLFGVENVHFSPQLITCGPLTIVNILELLLIAVLQALTN